MTLCHGIKQPGDCDLRLFTSEMVRNVSCGKDNLLANFGVSATVLCQVISKPCITWRYNLDLWPWSLCMLVMWVIVLHPFAVLYVCMFLCLSNTGNKYKGSFFSQTQCSTILTLKGKWWIINSQVLLLSAG